MASLYLVLNIATLLIPLSLSFDKRVNFKQYWSFLLAGITFGLFIFIPWDIAFTKIGIWGFNPTYLTGIYLFHLPIEEWMFFITIPYACVFVYEVVRAYWPRFHFLSRPKWLVVPLALLLFMAGIAKPGLYTSINFIGLSLLLLSYMVVAKPTFWGYFFITYLLISLPFLLVNGILTGSFIADEVVWYAPEHNLGIRIFTIPVEDFFYSMFLLLTVLVPYEFLKMRFGNAVQRPG